MPKIDVTDEAVIDSPPMVVYKAILDEFAGDFVGIEEYTFEPTDGKTKVQIRLNAKTNKLLASLVSPFVNLGKGHSDNMQKGFKALNSYLSNK